jgi:hypothetical protein
MMREWLAQQDRQCPECSGILGGHWRLCSQWVEPPKPPPYAGTVTWCGPHTGAWCFAEPCTVTWCYDDGFPWTGEMYQ